MSSRPSAEMRRRVILRSGNRCEYCLIHQDDAIDDLRIIGLSPEGRTTVHFLQLNSDQRIVERRELRSCDRFPPVVL